MAKLVSLNVDAAFIEGVLSGGSRRITCTEAADARSIVERAASGAPDLIVLGGDASAAADSAETLLDESALLETPLVAWNAPGSLADVARLVALGVRVVEGDEDALRRTCQEALDAREGRTIRVDAPTEVRAARSSVLDLHGRRVVVADDDPAITWFFSDRLRAEGCDVEEVGDGEAALDVARRSAPDLVLSDIRMPRMDGVRLCKALRLDPILADVPVVLLSWKRDWLLEAQDLGVEASGFLEKRSTPEEIATCVREVMMPQARLEQRIRQPGAVRGRLDGHAPYRLLRLACAVRRDARLTVRCQTNAYEIHVRDGAPRAALRLSPDGTVLRASSAVAGLLSERSGRFTLAADHVPVDEELTGGLHQQIAQYVARHRTGSRLPDAPRPMPVAAPALVAPAHAAASPEPAAPIVHVAAPAPQHPVQPAYVQPTYVAPAYVAPAPRPRVVAMAPAPPEPAAHTVPLGPRIVPARPSAERTALLARHAPQPPAATVEPLPRRRSSGLPRWVGVAAIAALGIVLGAGARMLQQPSPPTAAAARTTPSQP